MGEEMRSCHVVSGPAGAGKSRYAEGLAARHGAVLLDSDAVSERLVQAGLALAGRDPDDRDSPDYKAAFRDAVYETLFGLARGHLARLPVVIVGPFTREGGEADWPAWLAARLGVVPELHFVWCVAGQRRERIAARGEPRDRPKLADWEGYLAGCREERPVWSHHFVDTSSR